MDKPWRLQVYRPFCPLDRFEPNLRGLLFMNPYENYVKSWSAALRHGKSYPLGGLAPAPRVQPRAGAPKALIFSPHPDDEVIIGGLALRLARESGWDVVNVAVTQGSNKQRQAERWGELKACCDHIGFGLLATGDNGLEGVNLRTRTEQPQAWAKSVSRIREILHNQQPRMIFFPHATDWNSTHIGTHHLVSDALTQLGPDFSVLGVETEFWGAMDDPNLMVESSEGDVIDLISALTYHVGEVRRNPYHLRLPAWMIDNVRRGGELVGGQGGGPPDFTFATLYKVRSWKAGTWHEVWSGGRFISRTDSVSVILDLIGSADSHSGLRPGEKKGVT